jgi:uncharacterized repeat protein (TIGR02543 family)
LSTTADDWQQAVELNRSNTGTINVRTTNATLEEWEGYYGGEYDSWDYTNTVWFYWTATQDGNLTINTCNSDFDTVLQAGEMSSETSITASDDAECGSEINFDVQLGSTYWIQLGGYGDDAGLAQLNWSFVAGAIAYSVTYDGNNEDTGTVPSDSTSYSSGDLVTVASNSGTLDKTGYWFNGWCTTQSAAGAVCSGDTYGEGDETILSGDTTLYAQWEGNSLTVTTDEQEGTVIENALTSSGGSMSDPGTPTRTGYDFDGWFVASTGGSAITFSYTHGRTADFTLYAQWTAPAEWHVGDTGPGGGKIFYVDMRRAAGSQYFEAACVGWTNNCDGETPDPEAQWGCIGSSIAGADGLLIGTGEQNTADILAGCATSGIAARLADEYTRTVNGVVYEDWFLPAQNELINMQYWDNEIGGFSPYFYLSSFEVSAFLVGSVFFTNGSQNTYPKHVNGNVRPVRSF